jgi:hypothetical protein
MHAPSTKGHFALHLAAVLAGSLMLCWVAALNRFPLMYPDVVFYLRYGPELLQAVLHHEPHPGMEARAEFYVLVIYLLDRGRSLWPIVALNALTTAYTLWLVVRWVSRHRITVPAYLAIMVILSAFSGLSWVVGWPLVDLFGPLSYLALLLLIFAWNDHTAVERCLLIVIGWWGMAAHPTHLILGGVVCVLCGLLFLVPLVRPRWKPLGAACGVVVFSGLSLIGIHDYLYGKPSIMSFHPPYLTARIVADGPGRWYLQRHCPDLNWFLCSRVDTLANSSQEILFEGPNALIRTTSEQQAEMLKEETPLVIGSVRSYPKAELESAWSNFMVQLSRFSFIEFGHSEWNVRYLNNSIPGAEEAYWRGRQAHGRLPQMWARGAQIDLLWASAALFAGCLCLLRRRPLPRSLMLAAVLLPLVVLNAAICGALSQPDHRLQLRVIWLLPLVALLCALESMGHGFPRSTEMESAG